VNDLNNEHPIRLGYLVSRYPAISHTFILREVLELRRRGMEIEVASINDPDRDFATLTTAEQTEAAHVFYVKKCGIAGALVAFLAFAVRYPVSLCAGMFEAVRLARFDLFKLTLAFCYLIEAVLLAGWMKRKQLRHLHVHFATPAATVALLLSRIRPVSISLTVHGPDEFYNTAEYFLVDKIKAARFICTIGMFARSQLMLLSAAEHWHKFEVVPLGVSASQFIPVARPAKQKPFEILCVGRLVPAKGQHILLQAVAKLRAQGRRVQLRLVGDGPARASLLAETEKLDLSEWVRFEGNVNADLICSLYEAADAFALASFAEGIPVVLMEAMAMQIPCVATCVSGIPELIRHDIDGLLVSPSDAEALAGALARLMDDAALRSRLAESGRRRVLNSYDLETNAGRLADVFRRRLSAIAA
jgi:colanic acid/amylovoran biosynthesis glycosyltransferase